MFGDDTLPGLLSDGEDGEDGSPDDDAGHREAKKRKACPEPFSWALL